MATCPQCTHLCMQNLCNGGASFWILHVSAHAWKRCRWRAERHGNGCTDVRILPPMVELESLICLTWVIWNASFIRSFFLSHLRPHTHTHTQAVRTHRHGHTDLFTGTWPRHHHLHTHTHTLVETGLVLNYCLPWKKRRTEKKGASLEQQQKKAGAVKGHSAPGQIDVLAGKHIPAGWLWQACQKAH